MKSSRVMFSCVFVFVVLVYSLGCVKNSAGVSCVNQPASADSATLKNFAVSNGITATADSSGLYYQIIDSGSSAHPTLNSIVYVSYIGRFLNGAIFDSTSNANNTGFKMSMLIKGWQIGIPKIGVGGHIKLLIPSTYGYGCSGYASVPPNTPLYFDVTLVKFQ